MKKINYTLVTFPEIQDYMNHPRWKECFIGEPIDPDDVHSYWFVPDDIIAEYEKVHI